MNVFKRKKCNVCGRRYSKEEDLMNHKQIAHGGSKYDCKRCNRYFSSMEEMRTHLQREHSYKS